AHRRLPQGNVGRQDQREQDGGDEEAFVDLVTADGGKQHFPEAADDEHHRVNGQVVDGAMPQAVPDTAGVIGGKHLDPRAVPVTDAVQAHRGDRGVGLEAEVVHAVEHGRKGRQPDGDHDAFEVNTVAHVRGTHSHPAGTVENRVYGLVQAVPLFITTALLKVRCHIIEYFAQTHSVIR